MRKISWPSAHSVISDDVVHLLGLKHFRSAVISSDASSIEVRYEGPYAYKIPLDYVLSWYSEGPHETVEPTPDDTLGIMKDRDDVIELRLQDGSLYYIVWDVILMSCEPKYEHFGGFTEDSKAHTASWIQRHGSFRTDSVAVPERSEKQ